MAIIEEFPRAPGTPGIEPRWTHSAKDVVGTAYSTASPIWFTASGGVLSEIYFPTIDRPQIRDLQYLVTDGETFFHDVHRNQDTSVEYLGDRGLGVRIVNADRAGRYRIVMEVITDPHQPCLLLDTRVEGDAELLSRLRLFVLLSPHLNVGGWGNSANVARMVGYEFLTAHKDNTWLALGANVPFVRRSCGYVGKTDGWQDLNQNFELDWQFASAPDGNVALTAEIELPEDRHFTLGLAFGNGMHRAVTCLYQLSPGVDARHGQQRNGAAGGRRPGHAVARAHLPRLFAAPRRRLSAEFLDRRHALLAGHPTRRGRLSDHAGVPASTRRRHDGRVRSVSDGARRRRLPDSRRPSHSAGAMGREQRLLALDPGEQHRGPGMRV
jgi:hypothetical protein